jgi:hypothetical protein
MPDLETVAQESGIPADRVVEIIRDPNVADTAELLALQDTVGTRVGAIDVHVA